MSIVVGSGLRDHRVDVVAGHQYVLTATTRMWAGWRLEFCDVQQIVGHHHANVSDWFTASKISPPTLSSHRHLVVNGETNDVSML